MITNTSDIEYKPNNIIKIESVNRNQKMYTYSRKTIWYSVNWLKLKLPETIKKIIRKNCDVEFMIGKSIVCHTYLGRGRKANVPLIQDKIR